MCGQMSGDLSFLVLLLGMGLRQFSTSPKVLPEIKRVVRLIKIEEPLKSLPTSALTTEHMRFLKRKVEEYEALKQEIEQLQQEVERQNGSEP